VPLALQVHVIYFFLMHSASTDIRQAPVQRWTVLSLIEWGARYLEERGCDEARLHTDLLLAHVLQIPRMSLYLQFDRPLTEEELGRFKPLFLRRAAREPLQYVLGETEFMNLRLKVDRRALIPRPETELMVEKALTVLGKLPPDGLRLLDVGTGSGNIALAISREMPGVDVTAIDVSPDALALARENAALNGITGVRWMERDLMKPLDLEGTFSVIVANPPYISNEDFLQLPPEIRQFEPSGALTDGGDGLSCIRRIISLAAEILVGGGALFSEIAYNQEEAILSLTAEAGLEHAVVHRDYAGHPRILEARHWAAGA
jgi:release factor glutamine methyltransferase